MKRKILALLVLGVMLSGFCSVDVQAASLDADMTAVDLAVDTAIEAYESSVATRIAERAGAATQTGAKGISFEQLFVDKQNMLNFLKGNGIITKLTKNSTAQQVDVIAVDEAGKVVARYQLKDTPSASGLYETIKRVESGQYTQAQLIGTTETAEKYSAKALKNNISKIMQDSGISTKTTEKVAEKVLEKTSTATKILKKSRLGAKVGGVINGGIALAESIYKGSPLDEAIGYVSTETAKGAVSGAAAEAVSTGAIVILSSAEVGTVSTVVVPIAVAAGTVYVTDYCMDYIDDRYDITKTVSETVKAGLDKGSEGIQYLAKAYKESGITDKVVSISNGAKEGVVSIGKKISGVGTKYFK